MKNFKIQCNNNEEFIEAQKVLFKLGFKWINSGECIFDDFIRSYPKFIYDSNNLLLLTYDIKKKVYYKNINFKTFNRKMKLKNLYQL